MASATSSSPFLLSRQPIFGHDGDVFGYELRYTTTLPDGGDHGAPPDGARVLTAAVASGGLEAIADGKPALVRFTTEMLLGGCAFLLPPTALVVELPASLRVGSAVVAACRDLCEKGYALGLERLDGDEDLELLRPYLRFARVDMRQPSSIAGAVLHGVRHRPLRLVAHRVDTAALKAEAHALGCRLFQGKYFLDPTTVAATSPAASRVVYLRLLAALNDARLGHAALEDLIKADPVLVYQILRTVNSAAFPLQRRISSIREALVLLGLDQIRRWAMVWTLASLAPRGRQELLAVGLTRARACESLAADRDPQLSSGLFLAGLCSVLTTVLGCSPQQLVSQLPLADAISRALTGGDGVVGDILSAVIAHEHGQWTEAVAAAGRAHVPPERVNDAYLEGVRWTHQVRGLL
jgi:EAL and modified HD-GYP domain-containing signal transduction protein